MKSDVSPESLLYWEGEWGGTEGLPAGAQAEDRMGTGDSPGSSQFFPDGACRWGRKIKKLEHGTQDEPHPHLSCVSPSPRGSSRECPLLQLMESIPGMETSMFILLISFPHIWPASL